MNNKALFTLPPRNVIESLHRKASGKKSYAIRNYYRAGPIGALKRNRFECALRLASDSFGGNVIDMGCADGVLIPALSRLYDRVVAIDHSSDFVDRSKALAEHLQLRNVDVFCNRGMAWERLREQIGDGYSTMFLLETLEHVGTQPDIWGSKVEFLHGCFQLLDPGGRIVISVPKMVGPIILIKNLTQRSLRMGHDAIPFRQLLKSAFLYNADDLEPLWDGHHVGFNHLKLDKHLADNFKIVERRTSLISVFYVLEK